MGRWTLRHTDEVLVAKIESIINGAIRQSREEADGKTKPLMTYEAFVESLDEDDTFTTTLIEILLKELADRRTRPTSDRRLISHRTSESLHSLAVTSGAYHGLPYSRFRNRSSAHIHAPGLLYPQNDSLDEEEEDFGMADGMGAMEGARIDSALYDVYSGGGHPGNPRGYPPAPPLPSVTRADDPLSAYHPYEGASIPGRQLPVPHSHFGVPASPRRWTSVFGSGGGEGSQTGNATSLARRPSIYRPVQRRVRLPTTSTPASSEFSEFAARRRSSHRQFLASNDGASADSSQAVRGSAARFAEVQPPVTYDLPRATLFDPPSPSARDNGTRTSSPSSADGEGLESGRISRAARSQNGALLHGSQDNGNAIGQASGDIIADWRTLPPVPGAPRIPLRRGGIRPPETIFSLPPVDSILPPESDPLAREPGMPSLLRPEGGNGGLSFERELHAEFDPWSASDDRVFLDRQQETPPSSVPPSRDVLETPVSLPTPRSVSPTEETAPSDANSGGAM